jgi:pimeloyl-ACP methyl ester carboxylesterase
MLFELDGHAIDYEVRGEGRTIVLVHGLTTDRRVMIEAFEPALARDGFRRVYLDLPGHGASKGNVQRASADFLVEALVTFVQKIAPDEKPLALGYSYGGYLVQGLLRDVPLGGLALVCPVVEPDFGRRDVPSRRVVAREENLPFSDDVREREAFVEIAVHQTRATLELFQRVVHPANIAADPEFVGRVRYRYAMARLHAQALAAFDAPVAIACGRDDHWVGFADALALARLLRRASYLAVPDAGHLAPLEAPSLVRALLADWLDRVARAA